ncbi:helix-turn-helix domain-containing protein [Flavobacterium sp. GSP14]|uniref:helix-turn-helix domain-containing protein n=1 Tax=Flavobacterium sp. GSP14 TaxID=3401734 RepID=UPI003AAA7EBA
MNNSSNQQRIKSLYQMLFEMATGNLTFRIKPSNLNDDIDKLSVVLNSVATEMHSKILNSGFVNPQYSYQNLVQNTYILDKDFVIVSFSPNASRALGYVSDHLCKMEFHKILALQSQPLWNDLQEQAKQNSQLQSTVHLLFLTANQSIIPAFCSVSRLLHSDTVMISTVTTILKDIMADLNSTAPTIVTKKSEPNTIQNVYEHILKNLEEPLPSTKELSKMFGINEFHLKKGFRYFFNTSIYHFYTEERLKKAHLLIQQSTMPLKEIAFSSGFNEYSNFYKAFKKRFSYAPSDVNRDNTLDDKQEF